MLRRHGLLAEGRDYADYDRDLSKFPEMLEQIEKRNNNIGGGLLKGSARKIGKFSRKFH